MLETTEILKLLLTLCNEQKSGTLFLTTADNKACHIIFEQGQIEAMAFGSVKVLRLPDYCQDYSLNEPVLTVR